MAEIRSCRGLLVFAASLRAFLTHFSLAPFSLLSRLLFDSWMCEQTALQSGNIDSETGVDASFELVHEMSGKIRTGQWVGDCFLYTNEVSM